MKVKDPTKRSREAAILAETVAGTMGAASYAYIAVPKEKGWVLATAVEGEHGCWQINGGFHFEKRDEADYFAKCMNAHIGLTTVRTIDIVATSMRAQLTCRASKMIFVPVSPWTISRRTYAPADVP